MAEASIHYYLLATLAAQYLIDRTEDPKIFGRLGAAFARGETMVDWLQSEEFKGRLPRSMDAVQADWLKWLDRRFLEEVSKSLSLSSKKRRHIT